MSVTTQELTAPSGGLKEDQDITDGLLRRNWDKIEVLLDRK